MTDPFAAYGVKATSRAPDRLVGAMKTRDVARDRYSLVVAELRAVTTKAALDACLEAHRSTILQIHSELEFLWRGDGNDFLGLEREIEHATARVDAGLDFPRWEPRQQQTSDLLI
ncbi:hypothetical protein FPZ24_08240 [Sphingomonas panacisoli]|uniref:Uncharacterized protein n=1 Tax=Sphingomonas panacisoli TaxID=1813879 RepID=A0A5B8LIP2_9SPHN|nr:hypothetical protein [Sphingomonas panacisoli]QDZ07472.1 hypothetical protein FPZ24_08240 [Sphingomonas panacisoli]